MLLLSTGLGKRQNCLKNKVTLRKMAKKTRFRRVFILRLCLNNLNQTLNGGGTVGMIGHIIGVGKNGLCDRTKGPFSHLSQMALGVARFWGRNRKNPLRALKSPLSLHQKQQRQARLSKQKTKE